MSLLRPILRLTAVAALRGQTWAQDRVMDSDMTPLADALKNGPAKPYIVVYTDDDIRTECSGKEVYSTARDITLTLELGMASAVEVEGQAGAVLKFPQTDAGLELAVDMLEYQVFNALLGNVHSAWRELFMNMVMNVRRVPSVRGGTADKGTRWAARQTTFVVQPLGDLVPGQVTPLGHWARQFVALGMSDTNVNVNKAAEMIGQMLETQQLPDWRVAEAQLGLTEAAARAMATAPFGVPDEEAPGLTDVAADQVGNPDGTGG